MNICKREDRPRPMLITPPKGGEGDCTDETMAYMCDLNRIIQRYGGNLAELAAWRGSMSYGEQPPDNLEDALERLNDAKQICQSLGVETIADALNKLDSPASVDTSVSVKNPEGVKENETSESQPQNV